MVEIESTAPEPLNTSELIHSSGCQAIQEALDIMAAHGMTVDDLDPDTIETVIGTMASAESVDAQAAPRE